MAKPAPPTPTKLPNQPDSEQAKTEKLNREFHDSKNSMQQFRTKWEDFLDTAYARLVNTAGFKSRVREGTLSSLLWERSARVVAQLPTGKIQALRKDDVGKSQLMDIVWHKYVMPGANTDYSFFTKLRMWDYYSMVYGACPAFYDYRVDDEFVGPDWTVLDPRYVFPQAGRLSFQRCQFVFIEAYHNKEYVKSKVGVSGWNTKNLNKILKEWKDGAQPDNSRRMTNLQNDRGQSIDLHRGEIELVTKYERGKTGHWVTFAPQYDNMIVRDIENPHKNGRLPVVFKFCFPLLDSLWGMGDIERGQSLQMATDSVINLALDFAKFDLYPVRWHTSDVNASQNRYEPGADWKLPNGENSAGFLKTNSNSNQLMTSLSQYFSGALNRQNGTTQTNVAQDESDPSQGKTPQAIKKNNATENARDNWDSSMLEEAINDLSNGMINLIGTKQPKSIEMHIFDDDIKTIYDSGNKDVLEIFDSAKKPKITDDGELSWELSGKGAAKLTLGPDDLKGTYRYTMDSGTTAGSDDDKEHEQLTETIQMLGTPEGQMMSQAMTQEGRPLKVTELFKRWFISGGTKDWEEIMPDATQQSGAQQFNPSMLQDPQMQQMAQQQGMAQGMTQPGQPQQGMAPAPAGAPQDPQAQAQMQQDHQQNMQKMIEDKAMEMAKMIVAQQPKKAPMEMIQYKDASPLTKAHMEQQAGFTPDPVHIAEEQALMAGHAATTVNHNIQMQTPPPDPNMQPQPGQQQPNQGVSNG